MSANGILGMPTETDVDPEELAHARKWILNTTHYLSARRFASHAEIMDVAESIFNGDGVVYDYTTLRRTGGSFSGPAASHDEAKQVLQTDLRPYEYRRARNFIPHTEVLAVHNLRAQIGVSVYVWAWLRGVATRPEAEEVLNLWIDKRQYVDYRKETGSTHEQTIQHVRSLRQE